MKVAVKKSTDVARELTITIPDGDISPKVELELQKIARTVRLPGFRPGKVPHKVVKKRFSDAARNEVIGKIIEDTIYKAIDQEKIHPAGTPSIEFVENETGKDLIYKANVDVFPEITIKDLDKIDIEKPVVELVDADVDSMFETLQKQHTDWEKTDKVAKEGDRVTMDYQGMLQGKLFDGGSANDAPLVLGSGQFIDGFESGLIGVKKGESRELTLTFPEDYQAKHLAGQTVVFAVTAKEVENSVLPKLDKDFAARFGVDSIEKLRTETKDNMAKELAQQLKTRVKTQVMDGLIKYNNIDVPKALLEKEIERMQAQMTEQMQRGNKKASLPDMPRELFVDEANRRVQQGLLINHLIEENKLKVDEQQVKKSVDEITSVYDDAEAVAKYIMGDEQQLENIKYTLLEEQVVDLVLKSAKIKEKTMGFSEVMNPASSSKADKKQKKATKSTKEKPKTKE